MWFKQSEVVLFSNASNYGQKNPKNESKNLLKNGIAAAMLFQSSFYD